MISEGDKKLIKGAFMGTLAIGVPFAIPFGLYFGSKAFISILCWFFVFCEFVLASSDKK